MIISRELIQVFSEAARGLINSTLSLSLSLARSRNATRMKHEDFLSKEAPSSAEPRIRAKPTS